MVQMFPPSAGEKLHSVILLSRQPLVQKAPELRALCARRSKRKVIAFLTSRRSVKTGQILSEVFSDDTRCSLSSQCPRSSRAAPSSSRSTAWRTASTASLGSPPTSRSCGRRLADGLIKAFHSRFQALNLILPQPSSKGWSHELHGGLLH